jgi:streptogramin lyase
MLPRRPVHTLAVLAVLLFASPPAASAATSGEVATYRVSGCSEGYDHLAPAPQDGVLLRLCPGPAWVGSTLASLGSDGTLVRHAVPASESGPMAAGPGGEIWMTENDPPEPGEDRGRAVAIDRVAPDGIVQRFPLGAAGTDSYDVTELVVGDDGSAWVAVAEPEPGELSPDGSNGGELDRIGAGGVITRFRVPQKIVPSGLAIGPDGNLWFTGVKNRWVAEHSYYPGDGYVGRMTPAGEFELYPTPIVASSPGAIATAPGGDLWFTEAGPNLVGTIGPDGAFGRVFRVDWELQELRTGLTFGPEGDAWLNTSSGIVRVTPAGQQTLYPGEPGSIVTGGEGDIWALHWREVMRVTPGGPGIEVSRVKLHPHSGTVGVRLACGGSERGCRGLLELAVPARKNGGSALRLARLRYSVPAESSRTATLEASTNAIGRAGLYPDAVPVLVRATVAGGPALQRQVRSPHTK